MSSETLNQLGRNPATGNLSGSVDIMNVDANVRISCAIVVPDIQRLAQLQSPLR